MKTNNKTVHGITDNSERVIFIIWCVVVLISSIIGDGIILLATTKYKAIRLNKVIVVVIQHLAVSDLLYTVFNVLPTTVALFADGWVMG